jgi:5-methylthioadenosine/S-adenosylhomocysteine deaminase
LSEEHTHPTGPHDDPGPDLIIRGGVVLTMAPGEDPMEEAEIWVADGRISGIHPSGTRRPGGRTELIAVPEGIILPGLINGHCHSAMTLFRGYADDLPLRRWLAERIFPAEARFLSPDTVYWGSMLACLEMTASGTTTFLDGYFFEGETIRAAEQAGLRALAAQGIIDFPAPGIPDPAGNLSAGRMFLEEWHGRSGRIAPGLFCHSSLTCSERTVQAAKEISMAFGAPLQIHLSETRGEVTELLRKTGKRPVHYLDELGMLDESLIAAHAVHVDAAEMEVLRTRGVKVVHLPESNMKLGSGIAAVPRMLDLGLTVGLGTDGCSSNNDLDMFREMDTAAKLAKVSSLDPQGLKARTVLEMATVKGAALLGLQDEIGTLEPGKRADIIVVGADVPHLCPMHDPFSALVYAADGADVTHVIVDGRVLLRDRRFLTLDEDRIMARVREIAATIRGG